MAADGSGEEKMNVIDELKIVLGLDSSGVKKGMKEAESAISSSISSLTTKLGALSAAFTAAFSLGTAFNQYASEADNLGKTARALEMNVSELHAYSDAAALAGGSAEAFQGSLRSMQTQLARIAATGNSRIKPFLEQLGIDAGEEGRSRKAIDVMMELAEKAQSMSRSEWAGAAQAMNLDFGTANFLAEGPQKIKDMVYAQKQLGVVTDIDVELTETFNDGMANLGKSFRYVAAIIFREILPAFNKAIEMTTKFFSYLQKHATFVKAFFIGLAAVVTGILIPAFQAFAVTLLTNPVTWIIAGLVALALVIEDLVVWARGGKSAMADLWKVIFGSPKDAIETWEEIKAGMVELWEFIKPILGFIWQAFKFVFKNTVQALAQMIGDMKLLIATIKQAFIDLANTIMNTLGNAFNWVINAWNKVAGVLGMTKINVHANIDAAQVTAADATHGGAGASIDNSTHTVTLQPTYNVQANDTAGVMNEIENYNDGLAAQADGAY